MEKKTVYFARHYIPGIMFADTRDVVIECPDPYIVEWVRGSYSFTLHRREDIIDGDNTYNGEVHNYPYRYYHHESVVETLDEVMARVPHETTLIANMRCNGWDRVVWSRYGGWPQPFDETKDKVLANWKPAPLPA